MKALSLRQPWASLVMLGTKRLETRGWGTPYRGQLAIHASRMLLPADRQLNRDPLFHVALDGLEVEDLPRGVVLGTVELVDCFPITDEWTATLNGRERAFGWYEAGRWAWELRDPVLLPQPAPARGHLSLWEWQP